MPRARRRRLKRQRKKWGVQPKVWTAPIVRRLVMPTMARMVANARDGLSPSLSRVDILALAASAKDPAERRRYRKMLKGTE